MGGKEFENPPRGWVGVNSAGKLIPLGSGRASESGETVADVRSTGKVPGRDLMSDNLLHHSRSRGLCGDFALVLGIVPQMAHGDPEASSFCHRS